MTGKNSLFTKLGGASVRLSRLDVTRHPDAEVRTELRVIRETAISLASPTSADRIHLRAKETISFEPAPGPYKIYLELDAYIRVREAPLDEDPLQDDIDRLGESLLLPYTTLIIGSLSQFLTIPPLILPPLLEGKTDDDAEE